MKYCILFVIKIIIRFALYLDNIHIVSDDCLAPNEQFRSYILAWTRQCWWVDGVAFCWIFFIVIAHWNNSPHVDMSRHSDTFRANQYMLLLLKATYLANKQQIQIV